MKNDLFSIGPFTVHGYGLMIAIGVLSAYYMVEYRAKKKQMDWEKVFPLTVWSVLGGFLGSKILYLLTRLPDILANPALLGSSIKDGFVVYGGIIGGILTAWIYCKCTKWNFWKIFDIAMPAVAMAQGFGRIGCLLAGCGTTRPVVVVEKDEFMKMAHNMPKELQARDLLDKDGSYTAPMSFKGLKDYGDILFTRLSPSFMLQNDTAHDVYLAKHFPPPSCPTAACSVSPTVSASIMPRRSLKSIWSALRTGTGTDRMNG